MAQSAGHWHPNPQLMQQHPVPQGWQGPWPPAPGVALPPNFPGPPPMPPGANAHPHWKAGFWQYNPAYNMNAASGMHWAPGVGWSQNVPANFNPYKRIPRQPSPSYWQTQLSENGLGLEDMVPARPDRERESSRDAQGDTAPQTPWIWNPPSLTQTEGDRATPTRDFNNRRSSQDSNRSNSTPTRDYGPSSRRSTQDSLSGSTTSGTPVRDYFYSHPSGSRQGSLDSLGSRSQSMSQQSMSSTDPPSSSHSRGSSIYSGRWSSSQAPPFPAPPSTSTSSTPHSQQPLHAPVFTREPESFTSRMDLQPTFPSNIVRTPTYYQGTRRNTDETPSRSSRSPSAPHTSAPGSSSRGPAPEPLFRHHSLPTSSISSLSTFTEDITSVLSPLIDATSRSTAPSSLSRSRTEPAIGQAHLSTIPESASSSSHSSAEAFFHPLPVPPDSDSDSDDDSSEPSPSPSRDRQRTRERERERERNRGTAQDYDRARRMTTPYHTGARSANPLPPPPMERPNPAASAPPAPSPEPAHYARRIRKGFWNRRGDHLTPNMYVVYAPQDRAYPQELRDYPDEAHGYHDQYGTFVPYLPERPELPTSLPYHGRPPAQPYESFVVYSYI